jgi:gamma-glutamyltranspeptidase/glutathione hydrolase
VPGKRPRITLTPTLILKDGQPVLAVSVAGGDNQDQVTLQMVLNRLDFGLSPPDTVTAPRFVTDHFLGSFRQTPPNLGSLRINPEVGEGTLADLKRRGHKVDIHKSFLWYPTIISIDPHTKRLHGAGDPRAGRHAGAY